MKSGVRFGRYCYFKKIQSNPNFCNASGCYVFTLIRKRFDLSLIFYTIKELSLTLGRSNSMLEQTRHQPSKSFPALTSLIILFESDPFSIPAIDSSDSGKECSTHENYDIVTDSLAFQMKLQLRQVVG